MGDWFDDSMRCIYCGKEIPSLYPFSMCPTCGQPIDGPATPAGYGTRTN